MTPNEYLNEVLAKQAELAAQCQQNPQGLREHLPRLAAFQNKLRSLEALPAGPERTEQTTELFQDFALLMEGVEQSYGVLPSSLEGTLHAPAREFDTRRFWTTLDMLINVFQRADDLRGPTGTSASAGPGETRPPRAEGSTQDNTDKKDKG